MTDIVINNKDMPPPDCRRSTWKKPIKAYVRGDKEQYTIP